MNVEVNQEACIGCGACAAICPDVFELDDEGLSVAKKKKVEKDNEEVLDAVDSCPTGAISAEEEEQFSIKLLYVIKKIAF